MMFTARTEEDVDPEFITNSVAKSTSGDGVKSSVCMEENIGPVVSEKCNTLRKRAKILV